MEKKIVDYVLIHEWDLSKLEDVVIQHIKNGWQPIGGVSFASDDANRDYVQAMVKYES